MNILIESIKSNMEWPFWRLAAKAVLGAVVVEDIAAGHQKERQRGKLARTKIIQQ